MSAAAIWGTESNVSYCYNESSKAKSSINNNNGEIKMQIFDKELGLAIYKKCIYQYNIDYEDQTLIFTHQKSITVEIKG